MSYRRQSKSAKHSDPKENIPPSEEEMEGVSPTELSLLKAFKSLMDNFKITPADMHDLNVLVRPSSGDIVVVDLGNFRKVATIKKQTLPPTPTGKKVGQSGIFESKRRKIKVFIDKRH